MSTHRDVRITRLVAAAAFGALALASTSSPARAAEPLDAGKIDAIRAYIARELDALNVPGAAVVIVHEDEIVFAEGFGIAQPDGTPVTPQTPVLISSVSKSLTAMAVMQQVEAGHLALDARVRDYLPWFGAEGSETTRITVRDLLAHTSGWTGVDGNVSRLDESDDDDALERNVQRLGATTPSHTIGQFEGSDANYDALGLLVATVSGEPYEEYLRRHIFDPLAMHHTFANRTAAKLDGLASGYYPFVGVPIPFEIPFIRASVPSAFLYSSAEDLGHMLIAQLNGGRYHQTEILSAAGTNALHQPLVRPFGEGEGYAMGLWVHPLWEAGSLVSERDLQTSYRVPVILERNGDAITYASGILMVPEGEWGVAVVMNLNDEAVPRYHELQRGIAAILVGSEAPLPFDNTDVSREALHFIFPGIVVLELVGIAWATRNLRRWRRRPETAPHGRAGVARHVAVPLVLDLALVGAVWMVILAIAGPRVEVLWVLPRWFPDLGLALIVIIVLSLGWGAIRTVLSIRALRYATGVDTGASESLR
jgi:CubicO group peptidase (beta-lactamase class C family)